MTTNKPHESGQPQDGSNPNDKARTEQVKTDGDGVKRDAKEKLGK